MLKTMSSARSLANREELSLEMNHVWRANGVSITYKNSRVFTPKQDSIFSKTMSHIQAMFAPPLLTLDTKAWMILSGFK